jgi:hypothetical protein
MSTRAPRARDKGTRQDGKRAARALERFIQAVLDAPANRAPLSSRDAPALAADLWRGALTLMFRVAFLRRLDARVNANAFHHPELCRTWCRDVSPVLRSLEEDRDPVDRCDLLLRQVLALCSRPDGVAPSPLFSREILGSLPDLVWPDDAVAGLVREISALDLERSSRLLEELLSLEPGLTRGPSVRLRWHAQDVVVSSVRADELTGKPTAHGRKLERVEEIPAGRFHLCAGLGRKSSGSYSTPPEIVRFLVRETLAPIVVRMSPPEAPSPEGVLGIRVLDPSMGVGMFLIEACRFLGTALRDAVEHSALRAVDPPASSLQPPASSRAEDSISVLRDLVTHADPVSLEARCKRLIAMRCLHGIDIEPLAVDLARSELWLECSAASERPIFLGEKLVTGNALTGVFFSNVLTSPETEQPLAPPLRRAIEAALDEARDRSPREDGSACTEQVPLESLRTLARAWAGAVMEPRPGNGEAYEALVRELLVNSGEGRTVATDRDELEAILEAGEGALSPDLTFFEVFYGHGHGHGTGHGREPGFDAVLGNPPWDKQIPLERELFGRLDPAVLAAPTARERAPIYASLRASATNEWEAYEAPFRHLANVVNATYEWQSARLETPAGIDSVDGSCTSTSTGMGKGNRRRTSGHPDAYRAFFERSWRCLGPRGRLGLVLPQAFYSCEGSTGIRKLALERSHLELCLSFTNRSKVFDIGAGQRFALVIVDRSRPGGTTAAAFGLTDPREIGQVPWLGLELDLVRWLSPGHLCLPECRDQAELDATRALFAGADTTFGDFTDARGIDLHQEMNMTTDSPMFVLTDDVLGELGLGEVDPRLEPARSRLLDEGWLVVHEKGTFFTYDDLIKDRPRYLFSPRRSARQRDVDAQISARSYRLAMRSTVHATERRKAVFCVLPPGAVVGNSALVEKHPARRRVRDALTVLAVGNSWCFDFAARLRMGTNLNQFILRSLPWPRLDPLMERFLAHTALRLSCNHEAFRALWEELLGESWHERGPRLTWPVVREPVDRSILRAAIEAVVAHAFRLDRAVLARILSVAGSGLAEGEVEAILGSFDEAGRLDTFMERHDPYLGFS